MTELLNGRHVPWDFVSGMAEFPRTTILIRTELPAPAQRDTTPVDTATPSKRLVAGGLFVAGALAAHWRRGRS